MPFVSLCLFQFVQSRLYLCSDAEQARAIVHLCQEMNFTRIGIIYVQDTYGSYFNLEILRLSTKFGIEAKSIGYSQQSPEGTPQAIQSAVEQLKGLEVFITVLIVHSGGEL